MKVIEMTLGHSVEGNRVYLKSETVRIIDMNDLTHLWSLRPNSAEEGQWFNTSSVLKWLFNPFMSAADNLPTSEKISDPIIKWIMKIFTSLRFPWKNGHFFFLIDIIPKLSIKRTCLGGWVGGWINHSNFSFVNKQFNFHFTVKLSSNCLLMIVFPSNPSNAVTNFVDQNDPWKMRLNNCVKTNDRY